MNPDDRHSFMLAILAIALLALFWGYRTADRAGVHDDGTQNIMWSLSH